MKRRPFSFRRLLLLGCAALMLCLSRPAAAGIGDWWDIYSGAAETEIRRLNWRADVALAWHHSRRLFEVRQALQFAILGLKPPQIQALLANLDDPNQTLDDLRLPSKNGRSKLSARKTREQLGLPLGGLDREGIAVIRENDRMVIYHDIERRPLVRFGQDDDSAELLLATLQQDIRRDPPTPKRVMTIDGQIRKHSPKLIKDGRMLWHHGLEQEGCGSLLDRLPDTPTIGLCVVYTPRTSRRNERVADCPGDQVGGVFETVHLINGEEGSRSERWDDCVPKPPEQDSRFRWVQHPDRNDCHRAMRDVTVGILARGDTVRNTIRIGGRYREERKEWTYREEFPEEWALAPLVLTWHDPWLIKQDTCRITWNTYRNESDSHRVGRCTQQRTRRLTYHWQQGRTSERRPASPAMTPGQWRNVGQPTCPDRWTTWTTSENQSRNQRVNDCTQIQTRTLTKHWRQKVNTGGARIGKKAFVRSDTSPWRNDGRPICGPTLSTTETVETRTVAAGQCQQRQQRRVVRRWLTYPVDNRFPGLSGARIPAIQRPVTYHPWRDVGGRFNCPKPVASTTVSWQERRTCHRTGQESRHTSARYTLFVYRRQVTHNWLTWPDGRREAAAPPTHFGPWVRQGQTYSCRPGRGGGSGRNNNEGAGISYDNDGDGVTDSRSPGPTGHFGSSTSGMGSRTGWSDPSDAGRGGVSSWSGIGSGGRNSGGGYSGGITGGVASGDSFDDGGGYSGGSFGGSSGGRGGSGYGGGGVSGGGIGLY